ncbi:hypothetical protein, partial [Streptomyces incanus]|uniref:hypothetical protein n=1 Tax=Streptomyces incanus TaxID=887453 RepID=UPI003AA7E3FE
MTQDSGTPAGTTTGRAGTAPTTTAPPAPTGRTFWLEHAWLGDRVEPGVTVAVG